MLTSQAFAPYGDVIDTKSSTERRTINEGHTVRYHDLASLTLGEESGRPTVNIFRSEPLPTPLSLKMMERHPLSSQAFYPLSVNPYLVVVAAGTELAVENIVAFIADANQGVNYHPGTWHHYCLALRDTSDFLVIDRDGPGENCDEVVLAEPILIELQI